MHYAVAKQIVAVHGQGQKSDQDESVDDSLAACSLDDFVDDSVDDSLDDSLDDSFDDSNVMFKVHSQIIAGTPEQARPARSLSGLDFQIHKSRG